MEILIANIIILAINVVVLGLCLKLYTEYFKDKSINAKRARTEDKPDE